MKVGIDYKEKALRRNEKDIYVRRSCINGKVVWMARCKSRKAADVSYCRAVKAELQRKSHLPRLDKQRRHNILAMLNEYLDYIPITQALTPEQVAASKYIRALSAEEIATHSEFYDHIIEEKRRRQEAQVIRQQQNHNVDYV